MIKINSIKINSKEEAINKTKWLREKVNEWGRKFQIRKKDYIFVTTKEKEEIMETLKAVENFLEI